MHNSRNPTPMRRHHVRAIRFVLIAIGVIEVGVLLSLKAPTPTPEEYPAIAAEASDPDILQGPCQLLRVVDGDTIDVQIKQWMETVRLLRVNTPEKGQPGFEESKQFLQQFLKGKTIRLEFEQPDKVERDRYGRLLCYVFADSFNVNVAIVHAGWSEFWTKYGEGRYAAAFRQAERGNRLYMTSRYKGEIYEACVTGEQYRRMPLWDPTVEKRVPLSPERAVKLARVVLEEFVPRRERSDWILKHVELRHFNEFWPPRSYQEAGKQKWYYLVHFWNKTNPKVATIPPPPAIREKQDEFNIIVLMNGEVCKPILRMPEKRQSARPPQRDSRRWQRARPVVVTRVAMKS